MCSSSAYRILLCVVVVPDRRLHTECCVLWCCYGIACLIYTLTSFVTMLVLDRVDFSLRRSTKVVKEIFCKKQENKGNSKRMSRVFRVFTCSNENETARHGSSANDSHIPALSSPRKLLQVFMVVMVAGGIIECRNKKMLYLISQGRLPPRETRSCR